MIESSTPRAGAPTAHSPHEYSETFVEGSCLFPELECHWKQPGGVLYLNTYRFQISSERVPNRNVRDFGNTTTSNIAYTSVCYFG